MMRLRALAPLAALALLHAVARYLIDPRPIEGLIRPLLAVWFTGMGATYALTWVGHRLGQRLLLIWGLGSAIGFALDNFSFLTRNPTPESIVGWNWIGVGLGLALAAVAYAVDNY